MNKTVRKYLAEIGRSGGRKSKRKLSPQTARTMVLVREARRAFRRFKTRCFWSYDPQYRITIADIPWVIEQLKNNGDREAWEAAQRLCH